MFNREVDSWQKGALTWSYFCSPLETVLWES